MTIKGFLFDFDGLIIDSEVPEFNAWQEVYKEFGTTLSLEQWALAIGTIGGFDPIDNLEKQIGRQVDRTNLTLAKKDRALGMIYQQPILPGIVDYLNYAKTHKLKLGLASSSSRLWIDSHLKRLGIFDQFDCTFTSTEIPNVKPQPDLYLAALDALDIKPEEAIVFEDSPNGIAAAKNANIRCVAVPNALTRQLDVSRADFIISSLAEIKPQDLLSRFN